MAKKLKDYSVGATDTNTERTRDKRDYEFEIHYKNGGRDSLGLILHTPSSAEIVKKWIEQMRSDEKLLIPEGDIRIVTRIYS